METLQGNFLIATPQMPDPRFQEQVVYLCSHNSEGAMGLIVNHPSDYSLADIFKSANIHVNSRGWPPIYIGGPVEVETAFFLFSAEYETDYFIPISKGVRMSRSPQILHDIANGNGPEHYLFVLGYAGWSPGQLESELSMNGWLTLPAAQEILFQTPACAKWKKAAEYYGIDISLFSDEIGLA